ncbi:MAG: hypothetical protein ACI94C_001599, partial [Sediminicola sp.]
FIGNNAGSISIGYADLDRTNERLVCQRKFW